MSIWILSEEVFTVNKGVIVKIKDKYCVVMTQGMNTKKIVKKDDCRVGKEVYFLTEDVISSVKTDWMRYAIAAVLMLAVSVGAYAYQLQNTVYSVVALDINPSVEIELNRNDKVIGLEAINVDGEDIIDENMIGKPIEYVLNQLVSNAKFLEYLAVDDGKILLTTVEKKNDNDNIDKKLAELIENNELYKDVDVVILQATNEEHEEAEAKGVSVGLQKLTKIEKEINPVAAENRTEVMSVKEFFYSLENLEQFQNTEEAKNGHVKMNKEIMKAAIAAHKEAMKEEIEARKAENGNNNEDVDLETDQEDVDNGNKGKPENPGKSNENRDNDDEDEDEDDEEEEED